MSYNSDLSTHTVWPCDTRFYADSHDHTAMFSFLKENGRGGGRNARLLLVTPKFIYCTTHRSLAYKKNMLYMVEHNSEIKIKLMTRIIMINKHHLGAKLNSVKFRII